MANTPNSLRKNRFRALDRSGEKKNSISKRELLSVCLAALSLLATILTLVGYGVALSVERFGIPHESLFNSPFEIISLSVWGVLHFFTNVGKISFLAYYRDMMGQLWPALVCGIIGIGSVYFFAKRQANIERIRRRYPRLVKSLAPPKHGDRHEVNLLKFLVYLMLFWLTIPALFLVPVFLFATASFLLSVAPLMGMAAGDAHIRNDVLEPASCMPLFNRQQRLKPVQRGHHTNYAVCISIKTDRMPQDLRGRVVFSTSSSVVLFNPDNGVVVRMPTKDATIQAIDKLERVTTAVNAEAPSVPST